MKLSKAWEKQDWKIGHKGAWGRGFGYNSLKIFVSNLNAS